MIWADEKFAGTLIVMARDTRTDQSLEGVYQRVTGW